MEWHHKQETASVETGAGTKGMKRSPTWNRDTKHTLLKKIYKHEVASCTLYCRNHHKQIHTDFRAKVNEYLRQKKRAQREKSMDEARRQGLGEERVRKAASEGMKLDGTLLGGWCVYMCMCMR